MDVVFSGGATHREESCRSSSRLNDDIFRMEIVHTPVGNIT